VVLLRCIFVIIIAAKGRIPKTKEFQENYAAFLQSLQLLGNLVKWAEELRLWGNTTFGGVSLVIRK
jgi:hypothetical protein